MFGWLRKAERLFAYGQQLARQERFEEALSVYDRALTARPDTPGILLHKALALAELGRQDEAVAAMHQAMALQPANPVLPMFLGQIRFDQGDHEATRTYSQRALELSPSNMHAYTLLALADLSQGHIAAGYGRLVAPVPGQISGWTSRLVRGLGIRLPPLVQEANAMLQSRLLLVIETYLLEYARKGRSLAEQLRGLEERGVGYRLLSAIDLGITKGIVLVRRLATELVTLGRPAKRAVRLTRLAADEAYYLGHAEAAQAHYGALPPELRKDAVVQERLHDLCYQRGDFRAALRHLQRLEVAPSKHGHLPTWYNRQLGELWYVNGRHDKAAMALTEALEDGDREYKTFYYLALCTLRRGETEPARRLLARAVQQLHPDLVRLRLDEMHRVHQTRISEAG